MVERKDLSFFRVGYQIEDAYLAAVVTIEFDSLPVNKAKHVADQMKSCLDAHELSDIEVVFFCATFSSARLTTISECLLEEMPPSRHPKVGTSLGSGNDYSGTLGCFITIDGPNSGTYALTNCHVALPEQWNQLPIQRDIPTPFSITDTPGEIHRIDQPAKRDVELVLEVLDSKCDEHIDDLVDLRAIQKIRPLNGGETTMWNLYKTLLYDTVATIQAVKQFNTKFGQVAFSSGKRFAYPVRPDGPGFTMDWALIRPDKYRFGPTPVNNSMLPFTITPHQMSKWPMETSNEPDYSPPVDNEDPFEPRFSRTRDIVGQLKEAQLKEPKDKYKELSVRVLKRGRSTGYEAGYINEYESYTLISDSAEPDFTYVELVVVNMPNSNGFIKRGDSGSVVFDMRG